MTRTRFAPSPTGYMHIGNLRSALFSYLIAKHDNGEFILRIDDTNQDKYSLNAEDFIYEVLSLFNLKYDEEPYIQSERLNIYKKYAEKLINDDNAYYCFCNDESETCSCREMSLEDAKKKIKENEKYVIRQKIPHEGTTSFHDLVYGDVTIFNKELDDQILIKSDGYPTYNFANMIDDALMNITHVTRGCEYLSNTPKELLLYDALQFVPPKFVHLPLVTKNDGTKLDKDDDLIDLLNNGFLVDAITNYIVLLGWSPKKNNELFSLNELIKEFSIDNISTSSSCYDIKKLEWFNHHYIMNMNDDDYIKFAKPFLEKLYDLSSKDEEYIRILLLTYKNYLNFGSEICLYTNIYFTKEFSIEDEYITYLKNVDGLANILKEFKNEINSLEDWNLSNINDILTKVSEKTNVSHENLYMPIRIVLSGVKQGVDLTNVIYLLGKDKVLERVMNYENI